MWINKQFHLLQRGNEEGEGETRRSGKKKRITKCLKIKKITILQTKMESGLPSGDTIKNYMKLTIIKVRIGVISWGTVGVPGTPILLNLGRSYNHVLTCIYEFYAFFSCI